MEYLDSVAQIVSENKSIQKGGLPEEFADKELVDQVVDEFIKISKMFGVELKTSHGINHSPPNPYHTPEHTEEVADDAFKIVTRLSMYAPATLLDMNESDYIEMANTRDGLNKITQAIKILAAYTDVLAKGHDIVQDGIVLKGILRRKRGINEIGNEFKSAERIANEIEDAFPEGTKERKLLDFLNINRNRIHRDINATFPEVQLDAQIPNTDILATKIIQPEFFNASTIGRVLAMSDLFSPYCKDLETALKHSDAEFWEINQWAIELSKRILNSKTVEEFSQNVSNEEKFKLIDAIAGWTAGQRGFKLCG
ncbi:MAG: hypothetical protein U0525_04200 [Patescibacteria group bacterium]